MTAKVAVVAPAVTITDAGTVSFELLSETATTEPPDGAAPESATVQVPVALGASVEGEHCRLDMVITVGGVTVTEAVVEAPFRELVTITV